jgi:sugar lactone lactonase YvrE
MKTLAVWVSLLLLVSCTTASAPPGQTNNNNNNAEEASVRAAIAQLENAIAGQPAHMPWIYILATYYDRVRDSPSLVKWLTRLDELGWEQGLAPDAFRRTQTPEFRAIERRLDAKVERVNRASAAFTIRNQRDLVPEGIAYDPVDEVFYLSSLHRRKVLRVDRNGNAADFIKEAQDGMLAGLGMVVDANRRILWVLSGASPEMRIKGDEGVSMLAAYDLRGGRLVKKLTVGSKEQPSLLNDMALLDDGTLFITDTVRQHVVRLAPGANEFEVWLADVFRYPNGIAVSSDQRTLYVADFRGISRIELADKSLKKIETAKLLGGIDGLKFHDDALIGIQNAIGKPRVVRVHLAGNRVELLESNNPLFEVPTTGVVAGGAYYFIANPGLRAFDDNGNLWPMEKLEDPVMLRIALSEAR